MSLSSSTSLSQETVILHHPYQGLDIPGPRGAFESRQLQNGLYVRVDMPGVPPKNLKLRKYSDSRTVTFSGKAPVVWDGIDTSERVYGGYIVLDRDPAEIDMSYTLANGCLRLFFPNADGSLHSLSNKKLAPLTKINRSELDPDDPSVNAAAAEKFWGDDTEMIEKNAKLRQIHSKVAVPYKPSETQGSRGANVAHINPFLLSGVEGVYESKVVEGDAEGRNDSVAYVRMDMPGISSKQYTVGYSSYAYKDVGFGGTGDKESPYDEGGRRYQSFIYLKCSCCTNGCVRDEMKDGVLRLLISKVRSMSKSKRGFRSGRRAASRSAK